MKRLILLIVSITLTNTAHTPNRLRVCSSKDPARSYEVDDGSCAGGSWVPDFVPSDCICATGLWRISNQYCDSHYYLVSGPAENDNGEFTCFSFPAKVRRFFPLTSHSSYTQYLIKSSGELIEELPTLDNTQDQKDPALFECQRCKFDTVVIRINATTDMFLSHKFGVQDEVWQKCVRRPNYGNGSGKVYIQVIKSRDPISYLKSISAGGEESCDDIRDKDFPYTRTNHSVYNLEWGDGFAWENEKGTEPFVKDACSCPRPKHHVPHVRQPKVEEQDDHQDPQQYNKIHNTDPDYDSSPNEILDMFSNQKSPLLHTEYLKDNARTTASILSHMKNLILEGIQPPSTKIQTFEYIRYGRNILMGMCPELPKEFVYNLIGMFRILVAEVVGMFPDEYANDLDVYVHSRIMNGLEECSKGVKSGGSQVKFFWRRPCNEAGRIVAVEVNGSSVPVSWGNTGASGVRMRSGDLVLEVAWKAMLIAHYACADYFEAHPEDLSFMYTKLEQFLTIPYILFRWENPSPTLTQAYKLLNPGLNQDDIAEQVDACVYAAFTNSRYKNWMKRPDSNNRFIKQKILDKGMDRLTRRNDGEDGGHLRVLFNNKGYCLNKNSDPIKWTRVNPSVRASCNEILSAEVEN